MSVKLQLLQKHKVGGRKKLLTRLLARVGRISRRLCYLGDDISMSTFLMDESLSAALTENITHHRELEAAAKSKTCNTGDDRFAQRGDGIGEILEVGYSERFGRREVMKL